MYKNKRIQRVHEAVRGWISGSDKEEEDSEYPSLTRKYYLNEFDLHIAENNLHLAMVSLHMSDGNRFINRGNLEVLDGRVEKGVGFWTSGLWIEYLDWVWCWNRFVMPPHLQHTFSPRFGILHLMQAFLLRQHDIFKGAALIYSFQDGLENFEDWMTQDYFNNTYNNMDVFYLLGKLGMAAEWMPTVQEIEKDLDGHFGEYALLLTAQGSDLREAVHSLCEEHLYEHSKKGREDTVWGLFPLRICTFLKLAGHDVATFSAVHELMSIQASWLGLDKPIQLEDPYAIRALGELRARSLNIPHPPELSNGG
ncbi:MAG: hypothetical protein ACOY4U_11360 [Pseudomonadota bacterium]